MENTSAIIPYAPIDLIIASTIFECGSRFKAIVREEQRPAQVHVYFGSGEKKRGFTCDVKGINPDEVSTQAVADELNKLSTSTFSCEVGARATEPFYINGLAIIDGQVVNRYTIECRDCPTAMQMRLLERISISINPDQQRQIDLTSNQFNTYFDKIWSAFFTVAYNKKVGIRISPPYLSYCLKFEFSTVGNDEQCKNTCKDLFRRFAAECIIYPKRKIEEFSVKMSLIKNSGQKWELLKYEFNLTSITFCENLNSHRMNCDLKEVQGKSEKFLKKAFKSWVKV